jgi:hypothetical protein
VRGEVGDGVIDVGVGMMKGGACMVTGGRVKICIGNQVCANWGGAQVGIPIVGLQVWVFKSGVQVGVCRSGCCGFLGFHSLME